MPSARDHAADLLLAFDKSNGIVRDDLASRRETLADPRERGLLTELVYGGLRRLGTLDTILDRFSSRPVRTLQMGVRTALRLGLSQVLFLDRVPAHAAVDHAVGWARGAGGPKRAGFVNGVLRGVLRGIEGRATGDENVRTDVPRDESSAIRFKRPVFADPARDEVAHLAQRWSMPSWLVARWLPTFGPERTRAILRAGIRRPELGVRGRIDAERVAALLTEREITTRPGPVPRSYLVGGGEADILELVRAGAVTIQDPTSQRVAPLCQAVAGARVLDLCAAPGGKTLHLADLLGSGTVVAADADATKVKELEQLASRMGEVALEARVVAPEEALPFEAASFDAVLIDAPCTNTGVLCRRAEARWRLEPTDVVQLAGVQRSLLERALPLVKPGGRLVYSTCSLEPEENELLAEAFAGVHVGITPEGGFRVYPDADQDGGFAAVFRVR